MIEIKKKKTFMKILEFFTFLRSNETDKTNNCRKKSQTVLNVQKMKQPINGDSKQTSKFRNKAESHSLNYFEIVCR